MLNLRIKVLPIGRTLKLGHESRHTTVVFASCESDHIARPTGFNQF